MDEKFKKIIESLGCRVIVDSDTKEIDIVDLYGHNLVHKKHNITSKSGDDKTITGVDNYRLDKRYDDHNFDSINLFGNNILEVKVNDILSIIASYSEVEDKYEFSIKLNLSKESQFVEDERTIKICICRRFNLAPGYIDIISFNRYKFGGTSKNKIATINQKMTDGYYVNGVERQESSRTSYLEDIKAILSNIRGYDWYPFIQQGINIIWLALCSCIIDLIKYWESNLNLYLKSNENEENKLLEKKKKIDQEITKCHEERQQILETIRNVRKRSPSSNPEEKTIGNNIK